MHSIASRTHHRQVSGRSVSANSANCDDDVFASPRKNKQVIQRNYSKAPDTTYHQRKQRLRFKVAGTLFETYQHTLEQFPDTTLGSPLLREEYYDPSENLYILPCDKFAFDAILFYYQSNGILSRPETVAGDVFQNELRFFRIKDHRFPCISEEDRGMSSFPEHGTFKGKIWLLLEYPESSLLAKILSYITIFLILFSVSAYILETLPEFATTADQSNNMKGSIDDFHTLWFYLETMSMAWFTVDYLLRIIFAPSSINFIKSPFGLLDFIAIFPYYTKLIVEDYGGVSYLIIVRLIRIIKSLRLLKISRYYAGLQVFGRAVHDCRGKLRALGMCLMICVILFSSFLFYAEHGKDSTQFRSIPDTFWYTVITMVTVGYGDVTPKTILGKILGGYCAVFGVIILYCFPTPIVIIHFNKLYKEYVVSSGYKISKEEKELVLARS